MLKNQLCCYILYMNMVCLLFQVKRLLNPKDARVKANVVPGSVKTKKVVDKEDEVKSLTVAPSALFFSYNSQLGPPYHIILDTNFINFSIQNKLDPMKVFRCL
jgi:U3 small nucleolar RNA-associated protein 24